MNQSRFMSVVETVCNVGSGVLIAWVVTLYVIPWMLGVPVATATALEITIIYTTISMVRSFIWRRLFNGHNHDA